MSIHYCFIGRDADMFVFDIIVTKDDDRAYKREAKNKVEDLSSYPEESRP
jgi:hypothetical protein